MGDSTKPGPVGEGENLVHLPTSKSPTDSGQHRIAPENGAETAPEGGSEQSGIEATEKIHGLQATIADHVGGELAKVYEVDFSTVRRNGLRGSHAVPKGLKTNGARPLAKAGQRKKRPKALGPKPPKVDGLTPLPSPQVEGISGGKRVVKSQASLEHTEAYAKRTGRERLMNIAGLMSEELADTPHRNAITSPEAEAAAAKLLLLRTKDFSIQKRETDNTFFNETAKILLFLWPQNWRLYLNDRRIEDMMNLIRDNGTSSSRVITVLANWIRNRV